jgi:HEAT repeat protein
MSTLRFVPAGLFGICFSAIGLAANAGSSNPPSPDVAQKKAPENAKPVSVDRLGQTEDNPGTGSDSKTQRASSKPSECPGAQYDGKTFEEWKHNSQDLDPAHREQAIRVLGRFASANLCETASIAAIIDSLKRDKLDKNDQDDKNIVEAAKWAFLRIGAPAVDPVSKLLVDTNATVEMRRFAAEMLGILLTKRSPPTDAIDALAKSITTDSDFWLRWTAFQSLQSALSNEKDKHVLIDTAIAVLQDKEPGIRALAAEVLGAVGPDAGRAVNSLVAALKDLKTLDDAESTKASVFRVRFSILKALGDIHAQPLVTLHTLIDVLNPVADPHNQPATIDQRLAAIDERLAAIAAIGQFGPAVGEKAVNQTDEKAVNELLDTAVKDLISAFTTPQEVTYTRDLSEMQRRSQRFTEQATIAKSLGQFGPRAKEAQTTLENALNSSGPRRPPQSWERALQEALVKVASTDQPSR